MKKIRCIDTVTGREVYINEQSTKKEKFMKAYNLIVQDSNVLLEKLEAGAMRYSAKNTSVLEVYDGKEFIEFKKENIEEVKEVKEIKRRKKNGN